MKKILALLLTLCLVLSLAACGQAAPKEKVKIRVAASPTPHAEILSVAKEQLPEGFELEIVEYDDYVQPNLVVDSGELDANYFQHSPYLKSFNAENGTDIVSVALIHYEPFGIYAGKTASLADLADGAEIIIPNDGSNETRALLLLQQEGLIKLADGVDVQAERAFDVLGCAAPLGIAKALPGAGFYAVEHGRLLLSGCVRERSSPAALQSPARGADVAPAESRMTCGGLLLCRDLGPASRLDLGRRRAGAVPAPGRHAGRHAPKPPQSVRRALFPCRAATGPSGIWGRPMGFEFEAER